MSTALDNFRAAPVHELELDGIQLRYRSFGEGPAVLLIHGWPLSGVTYRHLVEALQPHYRCYVPDLPGAGATPWSPAITSTIEDYTKLLRVFVDHLKLESLALIGHDSGGGVARLLAAELGNRVACLVLQNTEVPDHIPPMVRVLKLAAAAGAATAGLRRMLRYGWFRRSPVGFGNCFGDRSLIDGEFFEACIQPLETELAGHSAALARLELGWTKVLPDIHARITAPIHLFWGEKDRDFFPIERARAMTSQFRERGEFRVIPNGKLYVHEEAWQELAEFCLPLLATGLGVGENAGVKQRQAVL